MSGPWQIEFLGCAEPVEECRSGLFRITMPGMEAQQVEVRTTAQLESILARALGKEVLSQQDQKALFTTVGLPLIEGHLSERGSVEPLLLLSSELLRRPGGERRLLQQCGLLP